MRYRLGAVVFLLAALLSACATAPSGRTVPAERAAAYEERMSVIAAWPEWGFLGRLSIDEGDDGGSGRLEWRTRGDSSQLDFRGTLGRGAWRLSVEADSAVLERSDGSRAAAGSVEVLLREELGWSVPVAALGWWVRGLRAPGPEGRAEFDDSGRIVHLVQDGWSIRFERYREVSGVELPGRIEAVSGTLRLKLVASRWATPLEMGESRG